MSSFAYIISLKVKISGFEEKIILPPVYEYATIEVDFDNFLLMWFITLLYYTKKQTNFRLKRVK